MIGPQNGGKQLERRDQADVMNNAPGHQVLAASFLNIDRLPEALPNGIRPVPEPSEPGT